MVHIFEARVANHNEEGVKIAVFTVTEVIDGDTFKVSPNWPSKEHTGNTVRPNGYDAPDEGEPGYQEAKGKLEVIILDKTVELKNPVSVTYGRLLVDVFVGGKNLADFSPEYQ